MYYFEKNNSFWCLLFIATMGLIWVGCSKDDEKDDSNKNVVRVDTYAISPTFVYGLYLVNNPQSRPSVENSWSSNGASFHVYVLQGNVFTDIGELESKETYIASASQQKPVHVEVPIPTNIDISKPYQVITTDTRTALANNKIVFEEELKRDTNTYCPSWQIAKGGSSTTSQSTFLAVYELLYVVNNTNKPIKVKHKGFDASEKWYSTKGRVSINPSLDLEVSVLSTIGDVISQEKSINANEKNYFECRYVPTGKKMKNACLVLEIDGKEVRTPAVSSDISIECGTPYFMRVKWDGQKLEWD
jgi:hypothetical protein